MQAFQSQSIVTRRARLWGFGIVGTILAMAAGLGVIVAGLEFYTTARAKAVANAAVPQIMIFEEEIPPLFRAEQAKTKPNTKRVTAAFGERLRAEGWSFPVFNTSANLTGYKGDLTVLLEHRNNGFGIRFPSVKACQQYLQIGVVGREGYTINETCKKEMTLRFAMK